jgi:hypothetical protein
VPVADHSFARAVALNHASEATPNFTRPHFYCFQAKPSRIQVHWNRIKAQNVAGAIKHRGRLGSLVYRIREASWIKTKRLQPVRGKWSVKGTEIRFWDLEEKKADALIKRMMNCLDCGFCVVECFRCRHFDRQSKALRIDGCVRCGRCLRLTFCMGWRHRFWRRVIVEGDSHGS